MISLKHQIELEAIFLVMIVAVASISFVMYKNNYRPQFNVSLNTPVVSVVADVPPSKATISSQISPDGTKKVIMKVTQNTDNTKTYDFSVVDVNSSSEQHIFTQILDSLGSMTIPFNTWSPDDQYFFIQQNTKSNKSVFVFKATGTQFAGGEIYLDVTDSFKKANTENNFSEATGWASESLIIINTLKQNSTKGSSYWLEVPSRAIIQLSTEF